MKANESAAELIERAVRNKFAGAAIEAVRVVESWDHDGDAILDISVIYNRGPLDTRRTLEIIREVRRSLLAVNVEAIPLFRFISKLDVARMKSEAA